MKVIKTDFNKQLKGKELTVGADSIFTEEVTIRYTGNTRHIKTIFGKIKEQAEFYIIKKHWDLWNHNSYRTIKNGPHWE